MASVRAVKPHARQLAVAVQFPPWPEPMPSAPQAAAVELVRAVELHARQPVAAARLQRSLGQMAPTAQLMAEGVSAWTVEAPARQVAEATRIQR